MVAMESDWPSGLVVDDRAAGRFKVHRSAFVDEAVLEREKRNIFNRCWLYLAHESEVRSPADFITRKVGGRPLLLVRDRDGGLNAYFNACPHRGALVCRERGGNRKRFQCSYHGWVFDDRGTLTGVPGEDAYPAGYNDDGSLNLVPVPHLSVYCGFIFVNYEPVRGTPQAGSLEDYLSGVREILELVSLQGEHGMEVVGGTQEYSVAANWKLLYENSADGYHAATTHSTYFSYIKNRDGPHEGFDPLLRFGGVRNLGNGHAVSESRGAMPWGRPYARWVPGFGEAAKEELSDLAQAIKARVGPERGEIIANGDRNTLIFPNLVVNDIMAVTVRTFYPVRPGYMEVNAWSLAPVGESASSRERRNRNFLEFLGPAGFATPDDVEMLAMCQEGYQNIEACAWNDLSRGLTRNDARKADEYQMRTFWRRWHQLLCGPNGNPVRGEG